MLPEKKDASYLWDMLDSVKADVEFIANYSFNDYTSNRMLRGAVERHIEIIGEDAGKISKGFRDTHPDIPWRQIIAQRNILIHEYGEIEHELI